MKPFIEQISDCLNPVLDAIEKIDPERSGVCVHGFHSSLIPILSDCSNKNFIYYFSESDLFAALQHIELFIDEGGLYIPKSDEYPSPPGFRSDQEKLHTSAISSLSNTINPFNYIITYNDIRTKGVFFFKPNNSSYTINQSIQYEDLIDWLKKSGYLPVDIVVDQGNYSVRGNIVDVFSISSLKPVRFNFFESPVSIHRFNPDTQLTMHHVKAVTLFPLVENDGENILFKTLIKNKYIEVFCEGGIFSFGNGAPNIKINLPFSYLNYYNFCKYNKRDNSVVATTKLYNVCIQTNGSLFAPVTFKSNSNFDNQDRNFSNSLTIKESPINVGDYVVHRNYGIGRFEGLRVSKIKNQSCESLVLQYDGGEYVSVSTENMDLVSYYAPGYEEKIKLGSLSNLVGWKRRISSIKKEISLIVDSILLSMSERKMFRRQPFSVDLKILDEFIKQFKFTDTVDQAESWEDILIDLTSNKPMDRVICGDVGFGKTELAERAAFVVSMSGKQVVLLAPTTILSLQLFNSFKTRFSGFPQNIGLLSRLTSNGDYIKTALSNGDIDIIIGTHSLLSDDISYKDVGLVIIDEEHRFGVKQKERIKSISKGIDVLSLTATPIPRTLQLTVSGIRNISTIFTPPKDRRPIITSVNYTDSRLIQRCIRFELHRGGQVFVVYNNVNNIDSYTERLSKIIPEANIEFIHGQESSSKIENRLVRFISKKVDVLVCSSIIEAGIDISGVNTIIIENSHRFGLAQLYQLRGRVGRSDVQAFAYLLIPKGYTLGLLARRRLETVANNTALGSGYHVAAEDLKIRGAGSLFGYKQSGIFNYIGKELYSSLIGEVYNNTINSSDNNLNSLDDVTVDIFVDNSIPEDYISSQSVRFNFYKNIFQSRELGELNSIKYRMVNQFGNYGSTIESLFKTQELRIAASRVGAGSVFKREGIIEFSFSNKVVEINRIISKTTEYCEYKNVEFRFNANQGDCLVLSVSPVNNYDTFEFVRGYLNILQD